MGYQRFSQIALESNEDTTRVEEAIDITQRQNSTDPRDIRKVQDYKEHMREMLERKAQEETDTNTDTDNEESNDQDSTDTNEDSGYDAGDETDPAATDDASGEPSSDSSDSTSTKAIDEHKEASTKGAEQAAEQAEKALECCALAYEVYSDIVDAQARGTVRHLDIADKAAQLRKLGAPYGAKLDISKHLNSLSVESYSDHPYTLGQMQVAAEGFISSVGEAIGEFISKLLRFIRDIITGSELSYSAGASALEKAAAQNDELQAKIDALEEKSKAEKDRIAARFKERVVSGCSAILGNGANDLASIITLIENTYEAIRQYVDNSGLIFANTSKNLNDVYESIKRWRETPAKNRSAAPQVANAAELVKVLDIHAVALAIIKDVAKYKGPAKLKIASKINANAIVFTTGAGVSLCGGKIFALALPPMRADNQTDAEYIKTLTAKGYYGFYVTDNPERAVEPSRIAPCTLDPDKVNEAITVVLKKGAELRGSYTHLRSVARKLSDWQGWIKALDYRPAKDLDAETNKQLIEHNKAMINAMKANLLMIRGVIGIGMMQIDEYIVSIMNGVHRYSAANLKICTEYADAIQKANDKQRESIEREKSQGK